MAEEKQDKLVKVKILQHIGAWVPGDIAEVTQSVANELLKKSQVFDGTKLVDNVRAVTLDEAEKIAKAKVDPANMSQAEMEAMGKKNVVATPADPDFEARAEMIKKGDEDFKKKGGKKNGGMKKSSLEEAAAE